MHRAWIRRPPVSLFVGADDARPLQWAKLYKVMCRTPLRSSNTHSTRHSFNQNL